MNAQPRRGGSGGARTARDTGRPARRVRGSRAEYRAEGPALLRSLARPASGRRPPKGLPCLETPTVARACARLRAPRRPWRPAVSSPRWALPTHPPCQPRRPAPPARAVRTRLAIQSAEDYRSLCASPAKRGQMRCMALARTNVQTQVARPATSAPIGRGHSATAPGRLQPRQCFRE